MAKEINLAGIVEQVYKLIAPLNDEHRGRVMRSVSALFQDGNALHAESDKIGGNERKTPDAARSGRFSTAATAWMDRAGITLEHLEQVFHEEDGKVSVIADSVPGSTKKEQTVNCYVLEGMRAFLETGVAKFTDDDADALCERIGCRDKTNHAANRSSAGNKLTGSRKDGFTVVAPGMSHAATLIKKIATPNTAGAIQ